MVKDTSASFLCLNVVIAMFYTIENKLSFVQITLNDRDMKNCVS